MNHMNPKDIYRTQIENWLQNPLVESDFKKELAEFVSCDNITAIQDAFYTDLAFGTGGMRGIRGAGPNRMNRLIVAQVILGLQEYTLSLGKKTPCIVIAYDSRFYSDTFAKQAATMFLQAGCLVYMDSVVNTTPLLSFSIRHLQADLGLCFTASHNPVEYNGVKVYNQYGGQITAPEDTVILKYVRQSVVTTIPDTELTPTPIPTETKQAYWDTLFSYINLPITPSFVVIGTPLHGTGKEPLQTVFKQNRLTTSFLVPEQQEPDGAFPTVVSANPEDPKALTLLLQHGNKVNTDMVCAVDPDSDRFAVGIPLHFHKTDAVLQTILPHQIYNGYFLPNGNQIGLLLLDFLLVHKTVSGTGKPDYILTSIVTSHALPKLAKHHGLQAHQVLTGFKWFGQFIEKHHDIQYYFGMEESFGFMPNTHVRDKDGIAMTHLYIQMLGHYKHTQQSISGRFIDIFQTLGAAFQENLLEYTFPGSAGNATMEKLMVYFRELGFPACIANQCHDTVMTVSDIQLGTETDLATNTSKPVDLPTSNVLLFTMQSGSYIAIRPSGTEPKIKFYINATQNIVGLASIEQTIQAWHKAIDYSLTMRQALAEFIEQQVAMSVV
jgi:phosphoglucomutase